MSLMSVAGMLPGKAVEELRIISLAPNLTEMIFALGRNDQLIGVTDYCLYPPEAKEIRRVGGLYDLSLEQIVKLNPDVVFHLPSHDQKMVVLGKFGIDAVSIRSENIADIYAGIETIGEKLEAKDRAAKLIANIKGRIDAVQRSVASKKKTVLYVVAYSPVELREIYAAGPNTFLDEMVVLAGGKNMMAESASRYPTVSREYLIANPPDVLIDNNSGRQESGAENFDAIRRKWLNFLGGSAKEKTRVIVVDDPHLTVPGPSVAESVEKIAKMLHGTLDETRAPASENE